MILGSAPLSISAEEINKSHTDQLSIAQGERGTSGLRYSDFNLETPDACKLTKRKYQEMRKFF